MFRVSAARAPFIRAYSHELEERAIRDTSEAGRGREAEIERDRYREREREGWAKIRGERGNEESSSTGISHLKHPVIWSLVILLCAADAESPIPLWCNEGLETEFDIHAHRISLKHLIVYHWTWWNIGDSVRYGWSIVRCSRRTIGWHGSPLRFLTWRRPCVMGFSCASFSTTWNPNLSTWGKSTWDLKCHRYVMINAFGFRGNNESETIQKSCVKGFFNKTLYIHKLM